MSNVIYEVVITKNPVFEIVVNNGAKGNGVIPGGLTNQVLVKKSNSDYDTMWVTASVVTPVDSVNGQVGDVVLDYEDVGASPVGHTHTDKMDVNGLNSDIDTLNFQTDITRTVVEGQISYNATQRTFNGGLGNDVIGSFFQETYYPDTKNTDSVTIPNGSLVQYDGAIGNSGVIKIKRCATNVALAGAIMGIATEDIGVNKLGKVTWFGKVSGIQTNGANYGETWVDGDMLYNSTTVAGGLTKVKPLAPSNAAFIGIVVHSHVSNGQLLIRPMFFPTLGQLSNVYTNGGASDGQVLVYDFANLRWHNATLDSTQVAYGDGNVSEGLGNRYTKSEADTLLGNKVDKAAGKSLVSDTLITDLSDGGDTTAHTHKSIVNEVSVDNAKVEALATGVNINRVSAGGNLLTLQHQSSTKAYFNTAGYLWGTGLANSADSANALVDMLAAGAKISRNKADANPALIVNQANASSTGRIVDLQFGGSTKAFFTIAGRLYGEGFSNLTSGNNSLLLATDTGMFVQRNVADTNTALIVNQANASSTGKILDLQFGGVSQTSVSSGGVLTSNYVKSQYIQNPSSSSNSALNLGLTGAEITHNNADAYSALRVNQIHASSTGLITDFQFGGVSKVGITTTGVVKAPYIAMPTHENYGLISLLSTGIEIKHNQADANPALIVNQANASSTGKILDLQFGGVSKAYVSSIGVIYTSNYTRSDYGFTCIGGQGIKNISNDYGQFLVGSTTLPNFIKRYNNDAVPTLVVNNEHASSTGLITDFQFGGVSKASVDKDGIIKIGSKTPSSATDTGVAGQIAWDANYIYVCTATNTWKRVAIATW